MGQPISEKAIFAILGSFLLFLLINFNQQLGIIYIFMLVIDFVIFTTDSFQSFKFETRADNRVNAIAWASIGYGLFIFLSTVIITRIAPQSVIGGGFVNSILSTQAANTPILSDNELLSIISWGILIPIIETRFFFGRFMEFIGDATSTGLKRADLKTFSTWLLMGFVSATFAIFHLTAKVAAGNQALIITFLFGMVSAFMVVYFGEMKQAVGTHVISNTVAVLIRTGKLVI